MKLQLIPALHRATHQVGLYLERAAEPRVTQAEAHILAHLAESGDSAVGVLHRALSHRRSTLTSVLDRLEGRGLLVREPNPSDRRSLTVKLTDEGERVAGEVHARLLALEQRALDGAQAGDLARALESLEHVAREA